MLVAGNEYQQLLGHIDIDVSEAMQDEIYAIYRKRKFERMDLIIKEGVESPEKLYTTKLIYEVTKGLIKIARHGFVNKGVIKIHLEDYITHNKELLSIFGREDVLETIKGVLDAEKEHAAMLKRIDLMKTKLRTKPNLQGQQLVLELTEAAEEMRTKINNLYLSQQHMLELLKKYEDMS